MQRSLLYILNPISGTRNKSALEALIRSETQKAGIPFSIYPSVASGDYSFLYPVIKEKNITDVVIAGGDGTINHAIHSLLGQPVHFGIIPCGSGNGLALSAGIPKDAVKALGVVFQGRSRLVDGFMINNRFACMLCGLGFDAQVAIDFANAPRRGLATYIKKTVQNFFTARAFRFLIELNGKQLQTEAFFISIANSNQFGNNVTIAPKASLTDGLVDVVIMTRQNKLSVVYHAIRQIGGFNRVQSVNIINEKSSLIYFQTDQFSVVNQDDAPMHIDGDPVDSAKQLYVKILPGCFSLIH